MYVIWAILIPLELLNRVIKLVKSKKTEWYTKRIKYGFLIGEFKPKFYYWGFIKIFQKMLIVFIANISYFDFTTKMTAISLIILIYMTIVNRY